MKFCNREDGFDDVREILNKGFGDDELDAVLNKIEDASLNQQNIPRDIVDYLMAFPWCHVRARLMSIYGNYRKDGDVDLHILYRGLEDVSGFVRYKARDAMFRNGEIDRLVSNIISDGLYSSYKELLSELFLTNPVEFAKAVLRVKEEDNHDCH